MGQWQPAKTFRLSLMNLPSPDRFRAEWQTEIEARESLLRARLETLGQVEPIAS